MHTIKLLLQLCFFRGEASKLPYSLGWLGLTFLCHFGINFMLLSTGGPPSEFLALLLTFGISYLLMSLVFYLALSGRKLQLRILKTLMAYIGTDLYFVIFTVILFQGKINVEEPQYLFLLFMLWQFAAKVWLVKQCLDIKADVSVILVITVGILRVVPFVFLFADQFIAMKGAM